MKTIFQKEWRENFKIAVIGFAIYTFLLVSGYHECSAFLERMAMPGSFSQYQDVQPLVSSQVFFMSSLFCGLFGGILGWVQIHNERHRDLWAFLVHRPIARTEIFFGKVTAGLCLYVAGAGLPLIGFIIMAVMPGHFPAPFEPKMLLPLTAIFLTGPVYYLGGLLTGVRQARWYVSRGLGLGAGIIISLLITRAPAFWHVVIFLIPALFILGLAAWGSFLSNGYYEGQSKSGRRALAAAMMLGCFLVLSTAMILLMSLFSGSQYGHWTNFQMAKDGTIYKFTQNPGKPVSITDLKDVPLLDKKNGRPMLQNDFYKMAAHESFLNLDFGTNPSEGYVEGGFSGLDNYFHLWRQTADTLWYWCPNGRLWGFDLASRRFIGSLGPNGFVAGASTGADRFNRMAGPNYQGNYYDSFYPARTLMTDAAVYELDYDDRTSEPFFTTTNHARIGGLTDISFDMGNWDYTLVATTNFISVLTPDGKCFSRASFESLYPSYSSVQVYFLETNQVAFWFTPNYYTNELRDWKLPQHIEWMAANGSVIKTLDLPSRRYDWKEPWVQRLPNLVTPPASYLITPLADLRDISVYLWMLKNGWKDLLISLVASIVFTGIGWGLGRCYRFVLKDQMKWAVFNFFFGLPGLLAFICVQEWPVRVACPHCRKPRMMDREKCEHCGADIEPPAKNGTEIFEAIGMR